MRIAVTASGFVRPNSTCFSEFQKYFVEPAKEQGHVIDLYVHAWDIDGTRIPTDMIRDDRYDYQCIWSGNITTLNRDPISIENLVATKIKIDSYDECSKLFDTNDRVYSRTKSRHQSICKKSMWWSVREAWKLIDDPASYDIIVRTRLDNRWGRKLDLFNSGSTCKDNEHFRKIRFYFPDIKFPTVSEKTVFLPWRSHDKNQYLDDMFAWGDPASMAIYCSVWDRIENLFDMVWPLPDPLENETIMALHLLANNVKLMTFEKLPTLFK
jgi:hypothetical protein